MGFRPFTPARPHPKLGEALTELANLKSALKRWGVPSYIIDRAVDVAARVGRLEELSGIGVE